MAQARYLRRLAYALDVDMEELLLHPRAPSPPLRYWLNPIEQRVLDRYQRMEEEREEENSKYLVRDDDSSVVRPRTERPKAIGVILYNSFKPGLDTLTWIEKKTLIRNYYLNYFTAFFYKHTIEELRRSLRRTYVLMEMSEEKGYVMTAAMLGVYMTRHFVLLCSGETDEDKQRKSNLKDSFPTDVTGKWCYEEGDILVLANFSNDHYQIRSALASIEKTMEFLNLLNVPFTSNSRPIKKKFVTKHRRLSSLLESPREGLFTYHTNDQLDLIFRPIFSKKYYVMGNGKSRMAAEIIQSLMLVFMHAAEKTFSAKDIGAALYFAQNLKVCALLLCFLLNDVELTDYYWFTMSQWYVGRSYVIVQQNKDHDEEIYSYRYGKMSEEFKDFHKSFYGNICTAYNLHKPRRFPMIILERDFKYPENQEEALNFVDRAFGNISLPREWLRSLNIQQIAKVKHCQYKMKRYEERVIQATNAGELYKTHQILTDTYDQIHELLESRICQADYKIFLMNFHAKCAKYEEAMRCSEVFKGVDAVAGMAVAVRLPVVWRWSQVRRLEQRRGLQLMSDMYGAYRTPQMRAILLEMMRKTFFDEVISQIHCASWRSYKFGLDAITRLLSSVLVLWYGAGGQENKGNQEEKIKKKRNDKVLEKDENREEKDNGETRVRIPADEKVFFDQIIGMLFNGASMLNCILAKSGLTPSSRAVYRSNAKYFHALSCLYMKRETVAYVILKAHCDHALLYNTNVVNVNFVRMNYGLMRCLACLCCYLPTLPIVWEKAIAVGCRNGPENYGALRFANVSLPVPLSDLRKDSTETENDMYRDFLSYIKSDVGFTDGSVTEVAEAQTNAEEDTPSVDLVYTPPDSYEMDVMFRHNPFLRYLQDFNPKVYGHDDCTRPPCPIDQYHEEEECGATIPEDRFNVEIYKKLFANFIGEETKSECDLTALLESLRTNLSCLLVKTGKEIGRARDRGKTTILVEICTESSSRNYPVSLEKLHASFIRANMDLQVFQSPSGLALALARVDVFLNRSRTLRMLRGELDLERGRTVRHEVP